jgi:hypothetical protein
MKTMTAFSSHAKSRDMPKVITFSERFPARHPKAGQPTFFKEKVMAGFAQYVTAWEMPEDVGDYDFQEYYNAIPKVHTIRAGARWKAGDVFSPRVWSGLPYASKQIAISPDVVIQSVQEIEIMPAANWHNSRFKVDGRLLDVEQIVYLARNDGLKTQDLNDWFFTSHVNVFKGQIICWAKGLKY